MPISMSNLMLELEITFGRFIVRCRLQSDPLTNLPKVSVRESLLESNGQKYPRSLSIFFVKFVKLRYNHIHQVGDGAALPKWRINFAA